MSRPPIFLEKTTAGIVNKTDGDRVVAASRRPDGTYRKELKIRPGYTPEEDIKRYRSTRMAEAEARAAVKGKVPGLTPGASPAQAAIAGMSKAQKKNAKRKEKRREEGEEEEEEDGRGKAKEAEDVPDSWDDGDDEAAGAEKATTAPPPPPAAEPAPVVDDEKRVKALRKKLRQAEQLRERGDTGAAFTEAEKVKVEGIAALEEEIARLSLSGEKDGKEEA
ncbi:hypothetical protein BCR35DRAFT_303922 [Leucosporidium creatinivorum]|uniref:WIBG Mago-binding domain-containing protein n=1 Tax=Leucosporidium creatinivorum TaxID=106004 RepID=A0A1Y2FEQ4_9BASI|nr:hypothetical protein BCR35DRAFT_303922 [Leucosporidium creatinivorum]